MNEIQILNELWEAVCEANKKRSSTLVVTSQEREDLAYAVGRFDGLMEAYSIVRMLEPANKPLLTHPPGMTPRVWPESAVVENEEPKILIRWNTTYSVQETYPGVWNVVLIPGGARDIGWETKKLAEEAAEVYFQYPDAFGMDRWRIRDIKGTISMLTLSQET